MMRWRHCRSADGRRHVGAVGPRTVACRLSPARKPSMRLILRWIVNAVALAITIAILDRIDRATGLDLARWEAGTSAGGAVIALFAIVIMAIVNALIRPIVTM